MPPRLIYAKRRKARNTQSEAGTSQTNVTVLTEDEESDAPFVAARSSTVGLRRSSRNRRPPVSTPSDERETAIPTFSLLEGYSGGGNQVEMLTQDFLCWQGLQSHKPEGELGYDDPTESFQIAHRQIREAFTRLTVSAISLTNKINELQSNSVPRHELVQSQNSLDR